MKLFRFLYKATELQQNLHITWWVRAFQCLEVSYFNTSLINDFFSKSLDPNIYGTAQLQGNVCTCPRHILHAFQTRPAHTLNASHIWQKRVWHSRASFIVWFCSCMNASSVCSGHVSCASQMHPACISDTSHTHFRRIWTLPWSWAVP